MDYEHALCENGHCPGRRHLEQGVHHQGADKMAFFKRDKPDDHQQPPSPPLQQPILTEVQRTDLPVEHEEHPAVFEPILRVIQEPEGARPPIAGHAIPVQQKDAAPQGRLRGKKQ
jgi:hypothetical protein